MLTGLKTSRVIVDKLFHAYYVLRRSRPIWAAKWRELRANLSVSKPESWNQSVGVWRKQDTIQLLVRYPARSAMPLVRPTQLDIGAFEYHFPSPSAAPAELGGFCMLLRELEASEAFRPLVPEFIHPPFQFTSKDWFRAGAWLDQVPGMKAGPVRQHRSNHLDRLKRRLSQAGTWEL